MNKRLKIGLIIAILAIVAVSATFGSIVLIREHTSFFERRAPPTGLVPGDLELFYAANTVISTISIALLFILTILFIDIYLKTRSQFTIGLIIFALVFLVKDVTSNPLVSSPLGFRAYGLGPFALLPSLFELAGLSVLLYLSIKY